MNKYDVGLEVNEENPLTLLLKNINKNSTILEFGPATGRLTKYLKEEMNCSVYIVEIDEEGYNKAMNYAVDGYLGDIEKYEWIEKFKKIQFDYVLFADVLEHLRNPEKAVKKSLELLKDDGRIGTSIPNIAHNSIILNLLKNTFQYNQIGLLDNTHIKFFTYYSAKAMLENVGLVVCKEMGNYLPAMANEFPYTIDDMSSTEKDALANHEYGNVYQFVFMAVKKKYYEENYDKISIMKNIYNSEIPYTLKLYVNTGNGDRDNESLIKNFKDKGSTLNFNLRDYSGIKSLRCDFFAADKCVVKIENISIDGENISTENLAGNQVFSYEDIYIFDNSNPFIYIMSPKKLMDNVSITFTLEKIHDFDILKKYLEKSNQLNLQNEDIISKYEETQMHLLEINEALKLNNENLTNEFTDKESECRVLLENEETFAKQIKQLEEEKMNLEQNLLNQIEQLKKEKMNLEQNLLNQMEQLNKDKISLEQNLFYQIEELKKDKMNLEQDLFYKNQEVSGITNSSCWRMTKPVRVVLDFIKGKLKLNHYTHLFYKTLVYLKRYGIKQTFRKIRNILKAKKMKNSECIDINEINSDSFNISELQPLKIFNKKIAVHAHLYYIDLIDEFIGYLNNIPYSFDLFVSCKEGTDIDFVTRKLKQIKNVKNIQAEITINRGRDIAPLYVQFGKRIEQYDYFLHIHTKKSLYSGKERYGWRQYALDSLLGSKDIIESIFALFESDDNIGLFCPEVYDDVPAIALNWLANANQGREILDRLGIPFEDGIFTYPVGSFFWAKMDAVKPLFEYNFKYDDFPKEAGQTDGTTAHALERVIAFVVKNRGYQVAIHEFTSKNIYFGRTLKPFQSYFSLDIDSVRYHLGQYEVVTFDIFDTLITRSLYQPDDVFHLMRRKIKKKYGIDMDFLSIRKKSESVAWEKNHERCSIHNIYDELPNISKISKQMATELKQMEIDTELSVCMPRRDMLKVFNYIKKDSKKIVLVSDMYLTSDIIKQMLLKCGYDGYDDLWISCEKGGRKDNNTIWPLFFAQYGNYKTIHVGDNMRSDIQILGDQGKETLLILDPITEFKLSKRYSKLRKYINTTVENSLMLGMLVNGGLYNSPFSLQVGSAEPFINEDTDMGYIAFGAMFTNFVREIYKEYRDDATLLFLAREGYVLEKIYNCFYESINKKPLNAVYFLSSRRAATVAAISNGEDVRSIINQYYEGGLTNLLKSRLGIDIYDDMNECKISMPADENKVMNMLRPHMVDIIQKANNEADLYCEYIDDILNGKPNRELSVIDVGYSGTIQYYLSKLLNEKISGYYLCTGINKKPEKLGCKCNAIYSLDTVEKVNDSKIFEGQLFLEAALQAPYGQFLCFKKEYGKLIPQFKDDDEVPAEITHLQEGIIEYCKQYSTIVKDIIDDVEMDKNLAEDIFYEILFENDFADNICNAFNVQDDYCSNGSHKFDIKNKKWNVV